VSNANRVNGRAGTFSVRGPIRPRASPASIASAPPTTAAHGHHSRPFPPAASAGTVVDSPGPSAIRASPMSRSRLRGFRSRHRPKRPRTLAGTAAGRESQGMSCRTTAASTSVTVSPSKSRRPVSISNTTTPKAQMSARRSTALPGPARAACRRRCRGPLPRPCVAGVMVGESEMADRCWRSGSIGLRQAEVEHLHLAVAGQLDVAPA
jgi:hypothetical protein